MAILMFTITFLILIFVFNVLKVSFFKRDILEIIIGIFVLTFVLMSNIISLAFIETFSMIDVLMIFLFFTWTRPFMNEVMDRLILGRKEIRVYNQARTMMFLLKRDLKKWENDLKVLEKTANETTNENAKALILKHYIEMKEHYNNLKENYDKIVAENNKEDIIKKIR